MSAEIPEPQMIDTVPGVDPSKEVAAQASPDATEVIDSVPGMEGHVPAPAPVDTRIVTTSTTNNMRSPILGLPKGMTTEQGHALARAQNAGNQEQNPQV